MSSPRQKPLVHRDYLAAPEECAKALMLLFKPPVGREAAHPAASNEAKGLENARPAKFILPN